MRERERVSVGERESVCLSVSVSVYECQVYVGARGLCV